MKKCVLLVLSLVFAFSSPVIADTLTAHSAITVEGYNILSIDDFMGQTIETSDLTLGETSMYNSSGGQYTGGSYGSDDFDLYDATMRASNDPAFGYMETRFSESFSTFFIFEHGVDDIGDIWAIYEDGTPGPKLEIRPAVNAQGPWGNTHVKDKWGIDTYLTVFELDHPAIGVIIESPVELLSISAMNTPIPGAVWLLGSGLLGVIFLRRKRSVK
jgi:hypothetical protein